MAQLEILQCSGCGSPLVPGSLACEYCGNKNIIKSKRNPLKITPKVANEYIAFYAKKTKKNPKDVDSLYAMGLLYLNLKNYELARHSLRDAIDRSPLDAEVYYYYALALLAGKNVKTMPASEVGRAEQYLGTAIRMETRCKYLALLAVVKQEYYIQNQLVVQGDTPRSLFEQAMNYSPDELDEITEHCILCSTDTRFNLDILTGAATLDDARTGGLDIQGVESPGMKECEAAYNLTAAQRRHFYDYRFEPRKPEYGSNVLEEARLRPKGSYFVLALQRTWRFALNLLLALAFFTVCLLAGWGFDTTEHPLYRMSVERTVELKEAEAGKKLTAAECAALIGQMTRDSISTARQDSLMAATHIRLMSEKDGKKQVENVLWLKKSAGGTIWFIIVCSPLWLWLIITMSAFVRLRERRRAASIHNLSVWESYALAEELYRTKPTDTQIILFIQCFLSTAVETELARHGKSENDLRGKTLFLNDFFDYREDGPNYGDSAVEYKIVLLEADSVSVITNDWRVYEDAPEAGTIESISYSDIKGVKLTGKHLSFGEITIEAPEEPIFEYQDDDPAYITFSNTCTSDVRQFAVALRRLQTAYKNRTQTN